MHGLSLLLHVAMSNWFSLFQVMVGATPNPTVGKVMVAQGVDPVAFTFDTLVVNETDAAKVGKRTGEYSQYFKGGPYVVPGFN